MSRVKIWKKVIGNAVFHMSFITQKDKAGKGCVDKKAFFSQLTGSGIHRKESIKILHLQIIGARYRNYYD